MPTSKVSYVETVSADGGSMARFKFWKVDHVEITLHSVHGNQSFICRLQDAVVLYEALRLGLLPQFVEHTDRAP